MSEMQERARERKELERVVAAFGADARAGRMLRVRVSFGSSRWMARRVGSSRRPVGSIVRSMLSRALPPGAARARRPDRGGGSAFALPGRIGGRIAAATKGAAAPYRHRFAAGDWRAMAALAASLMAGVYLGGSISLLPVLQDSPMRRSCVELGPTTVARRRGRRRGHAMVKRRHDPTATRRWVWPVLIASLALNALVLGVVGRALWQWRTQAAMFQHSGGFEGNFPA